MNDSLPSAETDAPDTDPFRSGAALAQLVGRSQLELAGADRLAFLHQLTTNHMKALVPGGGCETFLCDAQGKTLGHGYVFASAESLILDTTPGQAPRLLAHLDRYLIREKVRLADRTSDMAELVLAGPRAVEVLKQVGVSDPPATRCHHQDVRIGGVDVSVRRTDYAGDECFFVAVPTEHLDAVAKTLVAAGARRVSSEALDAARIEAESPEFARDISSDNLPQELARDERAISFVKGCYLGQETVARLDALGHVNRRLVRLKFPESSSVPAVGTELIRDGKSVGRVTSSGWSALLGMPIALGFLRRSLAKPDGDGWVSWKLD